MSVVSIIELNQIEIHDSWLNVFFLDERCKRWNKEWAYISEKEAEKVQLLQARAAEHDSKPKVNGEQHLIDLMQDGVSNLYNLTRMESEVLLAPFSGYREDTYCMGFSWEGRVNDLDNFVANGILFQHHWLIFCFVSVWQASKRSPGACSWHCCGPWWFFSLCWVTTRPKVCWRVSWVWKQIYRLYKKTHGQSQLRKRTRRGWSYWWSEDQRKAKHSVWYVKDNVFF